MFIGLVCVVIEESKLAPNAREALEKALKSCTECQACLSECRLLEGLGGLTPHDVVEQILNGQLEKRVHDYILRCDLCGLCAQSCPEQFDIPTILIAARQVLLENGATDAELYRAMWVDHDWNAFTLYRDTYRIDYSDLIKTKCDTLFFPGCALSSEAPGLTRAAFGWLEERGGEVGLLLMCCGEPLTQIGLAERSERHIKLVQQMVRDVGAHRVVTACPWCDYRLFHSGMSGGVEMVSLFQLMADAGVRVSGLGSGTKITVHDSCPDRKQQRIGPHVRKILSDYEIVEMAHHGKEAICCGSGGIASIVDPELSTRRAERRMKEFYNVGADICVTYCMSCASRLSRAAEPGKVRYILELVFNQPLDHAQNTARAEAIWHGKQGKYNINRLKNSCPLQLGAHA